LRPMAAAAPSALMLRIGDLPLRMLVACDAGATIAETAARMAEEDTASAVALDAEGRPVGIVTDSDLRRRVAAGSRTTSVPMREIMSAPVVTITRDELGLDAVEAMLRARIHHLVVVDDDGRAIAVVADSDLLAREAADPLLLTRRIERAHTIDELAEARSRYARTVDVLLSAGARPSAIGRILAEANDRLQQRLLAISRDELGEAPVRYAWVVMGSEARRVQTLRTDQDNGLIWENGAKGDAYFTRLAAWMVDALERCGVPRCAGQVMATNARWRGSAGQWRARFAAWLSEPEPVALLGALIAFDLRAVSGAAELIATLRTWLLERTPHAQILLALMARELRRRRVPLGPLGGIRLRAGAFDAKMEAIGITVDGARLLALELGIDETSTLGRIARAAALGAIPSEDAAEASEAYEAIGELRLRRQVTDVIAGRPAANTIMPAELSRAQRASLKEHLHAIARFQRGVTERFGEAARVE
jgi:CBS domain-containing protein